MIEEPSRVSVVLEACETCEGFEVFVSFVDFEYFEDSAGLGAYFTEMTGFWFSET